MNNAREVLKKAFIDANSGVKNYEIFTFSNEFESRMNDYIKSQKGIGRYINTLGKRVAVVILAMLILSTSAVFGVKAIREPVVEAIQEFFVNAKALLSGTRADEVSEFFPEKVTKIIAASHISESKNEYIIDQEEKITEFITLLTETHYGEPEWYDEAIFNTSYIYWSFDFLNSDGEVLLTINMCDDTINNSGKIVIKHNGKEYRYFISDKTYAEMLAFTNRKFYLHDSDNELPEKELCEQKYLEAVKGLKEAEIKEVKKRIRDTHYRVEKFLLYNVSNLKEFDSVYWKYIINGEEFADPITGDIYRFNAFESVIADLEFISSALKDKKVKSTVEKTARLWESAMLSHDLEGLFKAHEYIHDYDYFLFNYPTHYVYDPYADFQGLDDYFGFLS